MDIRVGISKEKYAKTVHLIKKLMKEMANGEIEPTRLEEAKTLIIEHNKKINDNLNSMIDQLVDINLFKFDDIDIEDEKIKKVTIEEIKEVSKKIVLDTIYMLHGGDKHGNN